VFEGPYAVALRRNEVRRVSVALGCWIPSWEKQSWFVNAEMYVIVVFTPCLTSLTRMKIFDSHTQYTWY